MMYIWGYCKGWDGPEVIEVDEYGTYHRIADGELRQSRVKVLGPLRMPEHVLGGDAKGLWKKDERSVSSG